MHAGEQQVRDEDSDGGDDEADEQLHGVKVRKAPVGAFRGVASAARCGCIAL
jgi:hypothetical protein